MRQRKHNRLQQRIDPRGNRFWTYPNGFFTIKDTPLTCLVSDGGGWEHVSVSCPGFERLPTWEEMALVKDLFWEPDEAVMQLHPPQDNYIDNAPVLHLWKPIAQAIPLPPPTMVGFAGVSFEDLKAAAPARGKRNKQRHIRRKRKRR